jgi:hypothetical protein
MEILYVHFGDFAILGHHSSVHTFSSRRSGRERRRIQELLRDDLPTRLQCLICDLTPGSDPPPRLNLFVARGRSSFEMLHPKRKAIPCLEAGDESPCAIEAAYCSRYHSKMSFRKSSVVNRRWASMCDGLLLSPVDDSQMEPPGCIFGVQDGPCSSFSLQRRSVSTGIVDGRANNRRCPRGHLRSLLRTGRTFR